MGAQLCAPTDGQTCGGAATRRAAGISERKTQRSGERVVSDKPRVAFFDFACCEGCQLTVLSIGLPLIDVLKHVDIVTWREAMSEKSDEYDIAIIEGAINRDSDVPRLKKIRERAKVVVAEIHTLNHYLAPCLLSINIKM